MYKLLICFFLFFISQGVVAQTITGTVYDDKDVVEDILVKNLTTRMTTLTNDKGHFKIDASTLDSISFQGLTHEEKTLVLKEGITYTGVVIALTRKINQLDEVIIKKEAELVFEKKRICRYI